DEAGQRPADRVVRQEQPGGDGGKPESSIRAHRSASGRRVVPVRRRRSDLVGDAQPRRDDLAASIQRATEEVVLRLTRAIAAETGLPNLCLAGGVALNCVANGHVLRDGKFRRLWIQPAAGDAGGALGAALSAYHQHFTKPRVMNGARDAMQGALLGPSFEQADIESRLRAAGARFEVLDEAGLVARTAQDLDAGLAVGW